MIQITDELIRLDTTIIGIDSLINKASTAEEAKVLFMAKDVIYSQQRYAIDTQSVKHGRCVIDNEGYERCSVCNEHETGMRYFAFCPRCGARLDSHAETKIEGVR